MTLVSAHSSVTAAGLRGATGVLAKSDLGGM
jgi:hypothetical protein